MTSDTYYYKIEYNISNISCIIRKKQQTIDKLSIQRNNLPIRYTEDLHIKYYINTPYEFEELLKNLQFNLIKLLEKRYELKNKLHNLHEEHYKELSKCNILSKANDTINKVTQFEYPTNTHTNNKCVVEKQIARSARSYSPGRSSYDNNTRDIASAYKKDRFERFLDFLTANLKILRFICIIVFVIIKFVYILSYIYIKLFGDTKVLD
jgi:hypothetical protein